jgi:orotidine-5'-phosphate decarboxylase
MTALLDPRDRLIVALDVGTVDEAERLVDRIGDAATFYKIGYRLAYAGGLALVPRLAAAGHKVFLDLKLHDIGNTVEDGLPVADLVARRAGQAAEAGIDGIVCSAAEAQAVRARIGADRVIVTPGIRPAGAEAGDQKRVMTPGEARRIGIDHVVVGRPITQAADPRAVAQGIVAEMR